MVTRMPAEDFSEIRGRKVMVIDDSNTIRRSAEIFLVQAGCQVILAQDGFEALNRGAGGGRSDVDSCKSARGCE